MVDDIGLGPFANTAQFPSPEVVNYTSLEIDPLKEEYYRQLTSVVTQSQNPKALIADLITLAAKRSVRIEPAELTELSVLEGCNELELISQAFGISISRPVLTLPPQVLSDLRVRLGGKASSAGFTLTAPKFNPLGNYGYWYGEAPENISLLFARNGSFSAEFIKHELIHSIDPHYMDRPTGNNILTEISASYIERVIPGQIVQKYPNTDHNGIKSEGARILPQVVLLGALKGNMLANFDFYEDEFTDFVDYRSTIEEIYSTIAGLEANLTGVQICTALLNAKTIDQIKALADSLNITTENTSVTSIKND